MTKRPNIDRVFAGAVVLAALPCALAPSTRDLSAARPTPISVASNAPKPIESLDLPKPEMTEELTEANSRLSKAEARLRHMREELAAQAELRAAAETKTELALNELSAAVPVAMKQEPRGTVIAVPSPVLFAADEPRLSSGVEGRLGPIAEALSQDRNHRILIEDHSNGQGPKGLDPSLSQARAEAVRDFLVSHGVRSDLVTATGAGDGSSDVGGPGVGARVRDRRVEIVVEPTRRR